MGLELSNLACVFVADYVYILAGMFGLPRLGREELGLNC